jgi:predicted CopG family antitoxin
MATKTITITEDAYNKLKLRKKPNESFSDVINRTMPYSKMTDFIGILSKKSADKLRASVEESRRSWDEPMRFIGKKLRV